MHLLARTASSRSWERRDAADANRSRRTTFRATTWADKYRSASNANYRERLTGIEVSALSLAAACFNSRHTLRLGSIGSSASDWAVDNLNKFPRARVTGDLERSVDRSGVRDALVGDVHQPLHSSDEHDGGGKGKMVASASLGIGTLHGFWYVRLVEQLGDDSVAIAYACAQRRVLY